MKTAIVTLLIFTSNAFAQLTLTNANNPVPGDIDGSAVCDTTNISEGNSGANQTWSFTNLTTQDTSVIRFVASSTTPYAANFPGSNIASTPDDTSYIYFATTSGNIVVSGQAGPGFIIPYSDPQLFLIYPFTFGSSFSDNFDALYNLAGTQTFRDGMTTITGDAWGTINLPVGSFSNSLRVKYVTNIRDSALTGPSVVLKTNTISYVWFVPGKKFPVFEIVYSSVTVNGIGFGSSKVVNYNSNSTSIGITTISSEVPDNYMLVQNYPNPFNPSTKIKFNIPFVAGGQISSARLAVYDVMGKEVQVLVNQILPPGSYETEFDAGSFAAGTYFYRLLGNGFTETKKMELIK